MIQRIQTLFLSLVIVCCITMFYVDFISWQIGGTHFTLNLWGISKGASGLQPDLMNTFLLKALNIAVGIFSLVAVFMFRNRPLQIRIVKLNMLLLLLFIIALVFYYFTVPGTLPDSSNGGQIGHSFAVGFMLPVIAFLLNIMALRGIRKDDNMVKSADRIR